MLALYNGLGILFILFIVLMPDVPLPVLGNARPEDGVLAVLFLLAISRPELRKKLMNPPRPVRVFSLFLASFIGLLLLTTTANYFIGSLSTWGPILKEMVRFCKYLVVLNLFALIPPARISLMFNVVLTMSLVTLGIQLLQWFNLFGVTNFLNRNYGFEAFHSLSYYTQIPLGVWRSGATFMNPNVLANFLIMPFAIAFAYLWAHRDGGKTGPHVAKLFALLVSLAACSGILLAGARTAVILLLVIISLVLYFDSRFSVKIKLAAAALLLGFVAVAGIATNQIRAFLAFQELSGQNSFMIKIQKILEVIASLQSAPAWIWLTGKSPGAIYILADSEYGYLLYWYGILGLVLYGSLLVYLIHYFWSQRNMPLGIAVIAIVVAFALYGVTATSFFNNRVFPLFLALLGVIWAAENPEAKLKA